MHLVYASDGSLRNHASHLPGLGDLPGVDLRASGGYIVAPPSLHASGQRYTWLDPATPIAPAPEWLKETPRKTMVLDPPQFVTGDGTPQGLAALRKQLHILSRAREGERNHALNRCAFIVGLFIRFGHLNETSARSALIDTAHRIGLPAWEITRTIDSALSAQVR